MTFRLAGIVTRTSMVMTVCMGAAVVSAPAQEWKSKLVDGFDGDDFTEEGGLYYRDNFEQSAGVMEFQKAEKRNGAGALKLGVKPICPADDDGCSERAEIWEKTPLRVPYDQPVWFGFAVKFADPVPQDEHRYVIAQWKREIGPDAVGDFSPFLALRLYNGRLFATVETNYYPGLSEEPKGTPATCAQGTTQVWLRPKTNQIRALVAFDKNFKPDDGALFNACSDKLTVIDRGNPLPLPKSGWMDFAILSKPGPDGTGHIEIFANNQWVVTVKGYIGHNDKGLGENQYFKFGPYRAAAEDEWTLYYDDFRRSLNCEDVLEDAALCATIN